MPNKQYSSFVFKILHVPLTEWILFGEAFILILYWRIITAAIPFRFYNQCMGKLQKDLLEPDLPVCKNPYKILLAVKRVKKISIFPVKCLTEAIVTKRMLARRGIPSVLYLGVRKDRADNKLKAHAWLKCGKEIITGRKGYEQFAIVSVFV